MQRAQQIPDFCIGDSVLVKVGTTDPDLGTRLDGWQGRVSNIEMGDRDEVLLAISWDSITLETMHWAVIEQCEVRGLDWTEIVLVADQVDSTTPRDTEADVKKAILHLATRYATHYLREQGRQIGLNLSRVGAGDVMLALDAWKAVLEKRRLLVNC